MQIILKSKLIVVYLAVGILTVFLLIGCPSSFVPEQIAEAQSNQSKTPQKETVQKDLEFLRDIKDPCNYRYLKDLDTNPEVRNLYDLINGGFPKETSLEEGWQPLTDSPSVMTEVRLSRR